MSELNEALLKTLKLNLPETSMIAVREAFEEYDVLIKKVKQLERDKNTQRLQIVGYNERETILNAKLSKCKDIEKREAVLRIGEQNLKVEILNIKLDEAQKSNKNVLDLVTKVFGHPNVTITKSSTRDIPVDGGGQCAGYVHNNAVEQEITNKTENKS